MPVEYKLRTLRRLFGAHSFFRVTKEAKSAATKASEAARGAVAARKAPASDGAGGGDDALFEDYPEPMKRGHAEQEVRRRDRRGPAPGGVPRAFFQGVPPRAVRNKAVSGQLYLTHLIEKQKMRVYYGAIRDQQFKRYVDTARRARFNVDAELMRLLEMRLDTVLYRTGFVHTPMQARQWICHNQILVNGAPLNIRSAQLRPGDVVSIRDRFVERALEASAMAAATRERVGAGETWIPSTGAPEGMLPWLIVDRPGLAAIVVRKPENDEARGLCRAALYPFIRDAQLNPLGAMRAYR